MASKPEFHIGQRVRVKLFEGLTVSQVSAKVRFGWNSRMHEVRGRAAVITHLLDKDPFTGSCRVYLDPKPCAASWSTDMIEPVSNEIEGE